MIKIIFENSSFICVDKPAGWLSVPSRFPQKEVRPVVGSLWEKDSIFPIHRLDYEVSGLLLLARNAGAHRLANSWFEKRKIRKYYQAFTDRLPEDGKKEKEKEENKESDEGKAEIKVKAEAEAEAAVKEAAEAKAATETDAETPRVDQFPIHFVWRDRILRGKKRAYRHPQGKPTWTEATVLGVRKILFFQQELYEWRLQPVTGRSHQLRFDLFSHGCPIYGDVLYGNKSPKFLDHEKFNGIALRCVELDLSEILAKERNGLPLKIKAEEWR